MKRKTVSILLSLSLIASILAGCGSNKEKAPDNVQEQESRGTKEANAEAASEAQKEPITLQVMSGMMAEKAEGAIEQEIADEFMKQNPHITIEFVPMPTNDALKNIITLATSGSLPDLVGVQPGWLSQFEEMEIFDDLRPMMGEEYVSTFFEGALSEASVGDKILMYPWLCTPTAVLYRTDWFEEEGIKPPTNWEEFQEAAQKMTKDTDGDGTVDRWGFSMVGTRNNSGESRFVAMARTWGVDEVINENGTWKSGIEGSEFEQFLKYFTDLNNVHKVVPPGVVETGYPEAANYFATGKTAMMITGSNAIGMIKGQSPEVAENMGSFILPIGTRVCSATNIGGYALSANSEYKEEAMAYLQFTLLSENIIKFAEGTGRMPTQKTVMDHPAFEETVFEGFVGMLDHAYAMPAFSGYAELLDVIGEAYSNIMGTGESVDSAVKTAKEKSAAILETYNKQ